MKCGALCCLSDGGNKEITESWKRGGYPEVNLQLIEFLGVIKTLDSGSGKFMHMQNLPLQFLIQQIIITGIQDLHKSCALGYTSSRNAVYHRTLEKGILTAPLLLLQFRLSHNILTSLKTSRF